MAHTRPPRSYRTARERVAYKRRAVTPATAHQRVRKRASGCNSVFIGLAAVLLLGGIAVIVITSMVTNRLGGIVSSDVRPTAVVAGGVVTEGQADSEPAPPSTTLDPFNVLLLGVDSRDDPNEGVRSDTLIVVHVNPQEQWASMLSIPRDSVVQIPYLGTTKINAAYTFGTQNASEIYGENTRPSDGGAALAAETVEQFLDIRIDYIAQVDFRGFERVVDTFGGLLIDIPQPLLDPEYPTEDFGYERIYIPAGLQVLDGQTALRYARSRHSASDFDRSCRQQRVLRAMLREVRERNIVDQIALLPEVVEDIEQSVQTTMPIDDLSVLRGLAELTQSLSTDRILQYSINPSNVQILSEQGSDIYWNQNDIELLVARMMQGPTSSESEVAMVQVQNGAGVRGLATRVTNNLGTQGFIMVEAGDAPRIYENTMIIDYSGYPEQRQRLADVLGILPEYVLSNADDNAPPAPYNTDIVVVLGQDYQESWAAVSESAPTPLPTAPAAPAAAEEEIPNLPPGCSPDF